MGIRSDTVVEEAGKWRSRRGARWRRESTVHHMLSQCVEPPVSLCKGEAYGRAVGVTTTFWASWLDFHYCLPKVASVHLWSGATQNHAGNGTQETSFLPKHVDTAQSSMLFLCLPGHTFALFFLSAAFPSPAVSRRLFKWSCILFPKGNAQGVLSQFWAFPWMMEYFFKSFVFPKSH